MSIKTWLKGANGWRRLWFVLSALSLVYTGLINPFVLMAPSYQGRNEYRWAVEKDFKNPQCQPYAEKLIHELKEPPFESEGGGCWHLYTHRKVNLKESAPLPYTLENYRSYHRREYWLDLLGVSGFFSVLALVGSGLVYLFGVIVAWVVAGFKGKNQQNSAEANDAGGRSDR